MLAEHLAYLSDSPRLERFAAALRSVVRPGHVVADLACGSGILGMLAVEAGASHVYCVDEGPMLDVAREAFSRAGLADRATFLQGRVQRVALPQPVDVAICDNVGWFGFDYDIAAMIDDARRRMLKPTGAVIPRSVDPIVAPVEGLRRLDRHVDWTTIPGEYAFLKSRWLNSKHPVELQGTDLLGGGVRLGRLDLGERMPESFLWEAELTIDRAGVLDGLAGWFHGELAEGIALTNEPEVPGRINRPQAFFPLEQGIDVVPGQRVRLQFAARPTDGVVAWTVEFPGTPHARLVQSTFHGMLPGPAILASASARPAPRLNHQAQAREVVWRYCDGVRSASEVEADVLRNHPTLLPSPGEIRLFVAQVLAKDTWR